MKKSELKTGMLLKFTEGTYGIILLNTRKGDLFGPPDDITNNEKTWGSLSDINEDLTAAHHVITEIWDITNSNMNLFKLALMERQLLWKKEY